MNYSLNQIISNQAIAQHIYQCEIYVGAWAQNIQAGQFIMIRVDEKGERFPLTIVNHNQDTITIIYKIIGESTEKMAQLEPNDTLYEVLGPLGQATIMDLDLKTLIIGGGVGNAISYAILKHFKQHKQDVVYCGGYKYLNEVFFIEEIKALASQSVFYVEAANDLYEVGNVLKDLDQIILKHDIQQIYCAGPLMMMKAVTDYCRPFNLDVIVSLNPIMVDGIGMCGGCRVDLVDQVAFACVDGPEFIGSQVDFETLIKRNHTYDHHPCARRKIL